MSDEESGAEPFRILSASTPLDAPNLFWRKMVARVRKLQQQFGDTYIYFFFGKDYVYFFGTKLSKLNAYDVHKRRNPVEPVGGLLFLGVECLKFVKGIVAFN